MKFSILFGAPNSRGGKDWEDTLDFVIGAETLGIDSAWSAEAWGMDAVAPLAYVAARTKRIGLGTGIMQISARAPAVTATTALTLATISGNRFMLGLGASGPQVVEGLHGVAFSKPMTRMRETIAILRMAFRGEKLEFHGEHFELPRPGGEGKPLRLALAANPDIPIYLATLAPRALEVTGELADGWLGTCFVPEQSHEFTEHMKRGAERAGRSMTDITLSAQTGLVFGDDVERIVDSLRPSLAFQLGAMGSAKTNFYNDAFKRSGFEESATRVQSLWKQGKRDEATAAVADEMILKTNLIGTDDMIRERLRAYQTAGIDTISAAPAGRTVTEKLDALARLLDLARELPN
jgi:F420-dependent oxidoreductase-like protein